MDARAIHEEDVGSRFSREVKDACNMACSVLGVILMASVIGYVQERTRAVKKSSNADLRMDQDQYLRGYRTGYADGYSEGVETGEPVSA